MSFAKQNEDEDLVAELTRLVGVADGLFEERWVRECFLPTLNAAGYAIIKIQQPPAEDITPQRDSEDG